jgi:ABC-type Fe3+-citrate transport system substrate-binding protein
MTAKKQSDLNATSLKEALWDTLNAVKDGTMQAGNADAVASQAREILRTVKVQLQVTQAAKRSVPIDIVNFAER